MAGEISDIMDSFSLTNDDETQCVGQPQTVVELRINSCKFNVFMVVYADDLSIPLGFALQCQKPWKCVAESIKLHVL